MTHYLKHTSCNNCGSSDANAQYSDGSSYCFSCGKFTSSKVSPYALKETYVEKGEPKSNVLPTDATKDYSKEAVAWAAKYDITVHDLLSCKNPIYYSPSREQLIFSWVDKEGNTIAWQARNLFPKDKGKRYFTKGDVNSLLPIYYNKTNKTRSLVLVEDCLSAMKCSSHLPGLGFDAMPLLGSGITNQKLSRLRPFYDVLVAFLDPDMYPKSVNIAERAKMLGFRASVVSALDDPKALSYMELNSVLNNL